jgi:predicted phosphodiesterase
MRALIVSDLHLEFWKEHSPINRFRSSTEPKPDIVILAGDIHNGGKAVRWAAEMFEGIQVLYVMGNHESYGSSITQTEKDIAEACEKFVNVKFLNCDEFVLQNVRFLGCTLWTDFKLFGEEKRQEAMRDSALYVNDYNAIRLKAKGYRKLSTSDTSEIFSRHKNWLLSKLDEPFDGRTVVITHMCPSFRSVHDRYKTSLASSAFSSNLDDLAMKSNYWIHGHTHDSYDYMIDACRVICNPCGYPIRTGAAENGDFNPNLIVDF